MAVPVHTANDGFDPPAARHSPAAPAPPPPRSIYVMGMAFTDGSAPYVDDNAFFNNGVDHSMDGAAQPLPFANVVAADPQFVDVAVGDVHLQPSSPLIDTSDPKRDAPGPEWINARDIDGEPVPWAGRADIGADEWAPVYPLYMPVTTR